MILATQDGPAYPRSMTWTPALRPGMDLATLPLDARQGYLLSRLDGHTDLEALVHLTGLDAAELRAMLAGLVALGAVAAPDGAGPAGADPEPAAGLAPEEPGPEPEEPAREPEAQAPGSHRQRYHERLAHLPPEQRALLARAAQEPDLSACCLDPMPQVILALLENPRMGPAQARLVAAQHPSAAGLEALAARAAFARDEGVRRALLANPVLPQGLFRRLWGTQRLLAQFQVTINRDCTEQVRAMARELLRATFLQRTGEERVELILATEGRCLLALTGVTLDGQATALLCRRTFVSTLLIQNIAHWGAAPPALIAHLRRQDAVRRNPALRLLLERHPNAT
jgi:hypothetical protein